MDGEIQIGTGIIKVNDLFNGIPEFMKSADVVFTDPPCSKGNLKTFYTKNDSSLVNEYSEFNVALFNAIDLIQPKYLFIEVFKSNKELITELVGSRYNNVSVTQSFYYHDKSKVCWIIQGSNNELIELPYLDEQFIIKYICDNVQFECIADPCMGRGLVGFYANNAGKRFVGTELNKKRLAVLIERINNGKL